MTEVGIHGFRTSEVSKEGGRNDIRGGGGAKLRKKPESENETTEGLMRNHNSCFCRRCSRRRSFCTVGNGPAPSPSAVSESNVGAGGGSSSVGVGVSGRLEVVCDGADSVGNGCSELGPDCSVGSGKVSEEEEEELERACSKVVVVNVGSASTVDVVDAEPSPSPRSVEGAAGGVVGAVSKLELVDELELVSIEVGNAVLDSVGSVGKVELAFDV